MLTTSASGAILPTPAAILSGRGDQLGLGAKEMLPYPSPQSMTPQQAMDSTTLSKQAARAFEDAHLAGTFAQIRHLQATGKDVPASLQLEATLSNAQWQNMTDAHLITLGAVPGGILPGDVLKMAAMINTNGDPKKLKALLASDPNGFTDMQNRLKDQTGAVQKYCMDQGLIVSKNGIEVTKALTEATAVGDKKTLGMAEIGERGRETDLQVALAKRRLALEATVHQDTAEFQRLDLHNKLAIAKLEYDPARWKHNKESEEALAAIRQKSISNACKAAGFSDDPTTKNAALGQHAGILEAGVKIADSVLKQAQEADQNIISGASKDPKDPANVKKAASQAAIDTAQENLKTAQKNYSDFYDTEVKPASARDAVGRTLPGYYYRKMLATAGGMDSHNDTHVPAGFKEFLNEMYRVNGIRNKTTNELATWEDMKAELIRMKSPILKNPGALGVIHEAFQNYQQPYSPSKDFSPMNIDPVGAALKTAPSKQPSPGISKQPSPSAAPKGYAGIMDSKDFQAARQDPAFKGASDKEIARWLQRHRATNESIPGNPYRQPIAGDKETEGPSAWEILTTPEAPQKPRSNTNRPGRVVDQ